MFFKRLVMTTLLLITGMTYSFAEKLEVGADKKFKTIQSAWNTAKTGDEIAVYPGKYTPWSGGRCLVAKNGKSGIYLHAAGSGRVECTGSFYFYNGEFSNIIIEGFTFLKSNRGIWLDGRGDAAFNNVIIRDNVVAECPSEGLYFYNRGAMSKYKNLVVENNTIYGCLFGIRWFVRPDGIKNNNVVRNNLAVDNKIGFYRYGRLNIEYCAAWNNVSKKGKNTDWPCGKGKGCLTVKPDFISVSPASPDLLKLSDKSPETLLKGSSSKSFIGALGPNGTIKRSANWREIISKAAPAVTKDNTEKVLKKSRVKISGCVFNDKNKNGKRDPGEKGIAGVPVSDGFRIRQSDSNGKYSFENVPADMPVCVFISIPNGWLTTTPFYANATNDNSNANFGLMADTAGAKHDFRFVHGADIQFDFSSNLKKWQLQYKRLQSIAHAENVRFVVCVGDLTPLGKKKNLKHVKAETGKYEIPFFPVFGGHDGIEPGRTVDNYVDILGPAYYSWNYGGVHFIALVSETMFFSKPMLKRQWEWLWNDLKDIKAETPVIVFAHTLGPISPELKRIASKHKLIALMMGHRHIHHHFVADGIPAFCSSPWRESDWGANTNRLRIIDWQNGKLSSKTLNFWGSKNVSPSASGQVASKLKTDWPTFWGTNGSRSSNVSIKLPLKLTWTSNVGTIQPFFGSPVISSSKIYFATADGQAGFKNSGVLCLDAKTGKKLWKKSLPGDFYSTAAVYEKHVYTMNAAGICFALDASNGKIIWQLKPEASTQNSRDFHTSRYGWRLALAPLNIAANQLLTVTSHGMRSIAVDSGKIIWNTQKPGEQNYPVAGLAAGSRNVYCEDQHRIFALNRTNGKISWIKNRKDLMYKIRRERALGSPVFVDNVIYFPARLTLRKLDLSGKELWASRLGDALNYVSSPAVANGKVVVANGIYIFALNASNGKLLWKFRCKSAQQAGYSKYQVIRNGSSPAIADGKVFCGSDDGYLYVLDLNSGKKLQEIKLGSPLKASAAISDNFVCISDFDGKIYGLSTGK
jgi:outer membrane protein assembly factor BamB